MSSKTWLAGGVAVTVCALAGCGPGKTQNTAPTAMIPLPPPPVGMGGGPPQKADPKPDAAGAPTPAGTAPTKK
jgi:hypothetical protein